MSVRIIDQVKTLDKRFHRFICDHLNKFDVSMLESIRITTTNSKNDWWKGYCEYPTNDKNATIMIATNNNWKYPLVMNVHTGTEKVDEWNVASFTLDQKLAGWRYTHTNFTFKSKEEAMIKVYGHEIFHYLKKTNQMPAKKYGRNGNPAANTYGLNLVREYRNFK